MYECSACLPRLRRGQTHAASAAMRCRTGTLLSLFYSQRCCAQVPSPAHTLPPPGCPQSQWSNSKCSFYYQIWGSFTSTRPRVILYIRRCLKMHVYIRIFIATSFLRLKKMHRRACVPAITHPESLALQHTLTLVVDTKVTV